MNDDGFDFDKRRYIPISVELAAELRVRNGDLFISRGNGSLHLVGRCVLSQEPPELIVFPDTMIRVRIVDAPSLREFVHLAWKATLIRRQIEKKARTTAGIYKISQRDVERFVLPLPPLQELPQIVSEIEEALTVFSGSAKQVDAALKRAARLRQSILKHAFDGKLVSQEPDDEPARILIERLQAERDDKRPIRRRTIKT